LDKSYEFVNDLHEIQIS